MAGRTQTGSNNRNRISARLQEDAMRFPLPFVPTTTYKGGNGFGASRDGVRKGLRHAANDLAAPKGTPVLAMDSGRVIRGPYPFFRGTSALEIQHPRFIGRYCEIAPVTEVKVNDVVKEGQVIAYVGDQPGDDMLHMEFFLGTLQGDLSYGPGTHPPYDRRDDVFNGVKFLDWSRHTVTHWDDKDNKYRYYTDSDGAKFVERMDLRDI
jgi:murein DD-endopeptidase MepM/ murein hydrolase activator NlpD